MSTSIIKNMIASRQQLDQYFSFYKSSFQRIQAANQCKTKSIAIYLAGKHIDIKFASDQLAGAFMPSLTRAAAQADRKGTSAAERTVFYIWQDDIGHYIPPGSSKMDIWMHHSQAAKISIPPGEITITAYDYDYREAYLCLQPAETVDFLHRSHPFKPLFHLWAKENNLLFVHSAGIEVEGTGILISGLGGRGKSTMAMNALLHQCGFIGDDYVLLDSIGKKKAYPIYSSGYLNPDMFRRMKELRHNVIGVDHLRNDKTLIDLMPMQAFFKESISLDFILFPNFTGNGPLSMIKVPPTRAMAQMIFSSANQNDERTSMEFMRQISECIKELPVYQFNMGSDLGENMDYLKKFVREWSEKYVQIK